MKSPCANHRIALGTKLDVEIENMIEAGAIVELCSKCGWFVYSQSASSAKRVSPKAGLSD